MLISQRRTQLYHHRRPRRRPGWISLSFWRRQRLAPRRAKRPDALHIGRGVAWVWIEQRRNSQVSVAGRRRDRYFVILTRNGLLVYAF